MDKRLFDTFRTIVYERCGIALGEGKEALVSARVGKRLRVLGLPDPQAYLQFLSVPDHEEEFTHFVDAITTNVTSFYREPDHFEFLTEVLSDWVAKGQRQFRIWCAAASTGEEPYTIAITVSEVLNGHGANVKILATDISTQVLDTCRKGVYSKEKVKAVPSLLRSKYMRRNGTHRDSDCVVTNDLKRMLTFARLNLATPPYPMRGPMDVIFVRNVMIYFDNTTRSRLLAEAYRLLKPGGYLMVGHAESLTGMVSEFKTVKPSIYTKAA